MNLMNLNQQDHTNKIMTLGSFYVYLTLLYCMYLILKSEYIT